MNLRIAFSFKRRALIWVFLLPLVSACRAGGDGKNYYLSPNEKVATQKACQALAQIREVDGLRRAIRNDVGLIKQILQTQEITPQVKDRVASISQRIQIHSSVLTDAVVNQTTQELFPQRLVWNLDGDSLDLDPSFFSHWQIIDAQVEAAYNWKGDNSSLVSDTDLEFTAKSISVKLTRRASALEVCELQQSIVLVVRARIRSGMGRERTTEFFLLAQNPNLGDSDVAP